MYKSLITIATILGLTSTSALAYDHFFQTGRSLGYGSAGTSSAHWSAAGSYNPALIGTAAGTSNDFFLVFNIRGQAVDQDNTVKTLDDFVQETEQFDEFSNEDLLEGDINLLQNNINTVNAIADAVDKLNGIGANIDLGGNAGIGMAFDRFAVSFQLNSQFSFGGTAIVDPADTNLIRRFSHLGQFLLDDVRPLFDDKNRLEGDLTLAAAELEEFKQLVETDPDSVSQADLDAAQATATNAQGAYDEALLLVDQAKSTEEKLYQEYGDIFDFDTNSVQFDSDDLKSNARFAAIGWFEASMTIGSNWKYKSGRTLSVGTTLKSVHLEFYDYQASATAFDEDKIDGDDYRNSKDFFTADLGMILSLDRANRWRVGISVKNIMGTEIESNPVRLDEEQASLFFKVEPQFRLGTSYNATWFRVSADIDVTESKGPQFADGSEFFQGSQFASVGAVINAWDVVELRVGYRHNLIRASDVLGSNSSSNNADTLTLGAGLYLGPVQFDLGLQAAKDRVGAGFQTMIAW
ncbi:conjugal transfer protein TraF [Psychrosphaera sp. F3M07]|uniref:conjugal transfer protein TraF n=1 Tax=Psychrosphaera sp. F3M07 TaxID=2841560 RepID=UPI001C08ADDA|nr:conjugal transfer protein TraF [Psychrosphaera sp. F3M07]MBU2919523.1 conjugal transfer protein TraF [Psychrosphaera sp. F3M07]